MLVQIVVVFMSLGFIGFVTVLHIIGKVRTHCSPQLRCSAMLSPCHAALGNQTIHCKWGPACSRRIG